MGFRMKKIIRTKGKKRKLRDREKTCLNCLYEPEWGEWVGIGEYRRKVGRCSLVLKLPKNSPAVYSLTSKPITRYTDDSGIYTGVFCKAWKPKKRRK